MAKLSGRHTRTRERVFETPTLANIDWGDIESLVTALGGEVAEGRGSRVRFALNGVKATFHRPHPQKEAKKYAVEAVRDYLVEAGEGV